MARIGLVFLGLLAGLGCCTRYTSGFASAPVFFRGIAYRSPTRRCAPAALRTVAPNSATQSTPVPDTPESTTSTAATADGDDGGEGAAERSKPAEIDVAQQKALLMRLILATSLGDSDSQKAAEEVNAIIERLETLGRGFNEDQVDGEWVLCFTRNGEGSPSLQKAMPGDRGFQNFDVKRKRFLNLVRLWGGKVKVSADLSYNVKPSNPDRLEATIERARVNFGPIPVRLPFKGRVGYLDFKYQDEDIRITRGDRGGLFLHMRPGSSFSED